MALFVFGALLVGFIGGFLVGRGQTASLKDTSDSKVLRPNEYWNGQRLAIISMLYGNVLIRQRAIEGLEQERRAHERILALRELRLTAEVMGGDLPDPLLEEFKKLEGELAKREVSGALV